jgi:flavin-dependent dehydrogenase
VRRAPLILGAGPAGASAAIVLARAGAAPQVIERQREIPDALCGGFLSWRTLAALERLGIAADRLNPTRIGTVRLFAARRMVAAPLPAPALAVSRRRLDTVLADVATAAGARIERGVTVRAVDEAGVRTADGATLDSGAMFLANGKHDVRGAARPAAARGDDPTLGLRWRCPPAPALTRMVAGAIELHLVARGYVGIALQEDGSANVCMAIRRSRLHAAGGPAALLRVLAAEAPALAERLAFVGEGAGDAIANVPYGWRATAGAVGRYRLGDQAAVIPSLAGEGIGIAVASGASAAAAYLRDGATGAQGWQRSFARRAAAPLGWAGAVWRIAERPALAALLLPAARAGRVIPLIAALTRIDGRHGE